MTPDEQLELLVELKIEMRNLYEDQAETRHQLHGLQREFDQYVGARIADRFSEFERQMSKRIEQLAIQDERHSQQIQALATSMQNAGVEIDNKGLTIQMIQSAANENQENSFQAENQQNQVGEGNQQS